MTKQVIPIHGPDHTLGGPDPFRPELPTVVATNADASTQTVSATAELTFSTVKTNDGDCFGWDPDDPKGVVILLSGFYAFFATVNVSGSDIGVARTVYNACQPLASGPLAGVGTELGAGNFFLGTGQGSASIAAVTTIAKSTLSHIAIADVQVPADDWMRAAVILEFVSSSYTLSSTPSGLTIMRVGGARGNAPVPPDPPA